MSDDTDRRALPPAAREAARAAVARVWLSHLEAANPNTRWVLLEEGEEPPANALGVRDFPLRRTADET